MAKFDLLDYLRDLLFFGNLHVDFVTAIPPSTGDDVAAVLAENLFQRFNRLIGEDGAAIGRHPVHRARVGVEILRQYLAQFSVSVTDADRRYRQRAYEALLINLGTSFEELRLVRPSDDEEVT